MELYPIMVISGVRWGVVCISLVFLNNMLVLPSLSQGHKTTSVQVSPEVPFCVEGLAVSHGDGPRDIHILVFMVCVTLSPGEWSLLIDRMLKNRIWQK